MEYNGVMNLFDHLHPAIVHFPITLLIVASATGLAYLYWLPLRELALATWASMAVGWIAALAAVLSGLVAQSGLPPRPPYAIVLNMHIAGGVAILIVYGALLYRAWILRQRAKRKSSTLLPELLDHPNARIINTILLVLGALLVVYTAYNGGQLVYVWGVNVGQ